ncbi:MAG: hypothetical protein ACK6AD_01835 [Cyanobacteriota bacterium]|jgi:hypothetical protein
MPHNPEVPPIPRAGLEIAPLAALVRIPFPPCAAALPRLRVLGESTIGAVVVCAAYQTVLTTLRTESSVRRGEFNRRRQINLVLNSLVPSLQEGIPPSFSLSLSLSLLRLLLPSLSLPLGIFGVLGVGKISERLFNAYWDGLNHGQKAELRRKAFAAGMNLRYRLDGMDVTVES